MRRRYLWFGLSGVVILAGAIALGTRGLNLGIDFKGGTQVTFSTPTPTAIATVRDQAARIGQGDAQIQGRGAQFSGDRYEQFQVRTKQLLPAQQARLQEDLTSAVQARSFGIKSVSSSFSRQILELAVVAIVVSFLLIALFVWMRYRWRFAVPILRTLGNDVLITLGVYSISGREVSTSTVAAILTILGYSIYDTIIVFDRIRENMKLMGRSTIAEIANVSVWEVLQRSIYTSLITLLPIAALFVFGGATLQDFAFAIMVGIIVGAVGTIFIATPLLVTLMERDPEYARRKTRAAGTDGDSAVLLRDAERAAAAEPAPEVVLDPIGVAEDAVEDAAAALKRERRKQRRRTRPHGRAR
jgi:SecD/SecF fusion protein